MVKRPGRRHTMVLHLEPKRAATTVGCIVMTLIALAVGVAAVIYPASWPKPDPPEISDRTLSIVVAVAAFFALVFLWAAMSNGRRWRTARAIVRLSEDPRWSSFMPQEQLVPRRIAASTVPPLQIRIDKPKKYRRHQLQLRPVTPERNIVGLPPLHILYLRLFDNQPRMRTFIEGAWREFGFVYMLRSATSVTPRELRWAKHQGSYSALFIDSEERLWSDCERCGYQSRPKGRYTFKNIAPTTIRVRDKFGNYPARPLLCHGTFWQSAINTLLTRVDLVAMDLSGFTEANAGTQFELQRVVDAFPIERVVFLTDKNTNEKFIAAQLTSAWSHMAAGSPNATSGGRVAVIAETDFFVQTQQQQGQSTQVYVQLKARRSQTRQVALDAQTRISGLAAVDAGVHR